jgi:hypothetical protein
MPAITFRQSNGVQWIVTHCETVIPREGIKGMSGAEVIEALARCDEFQGRFANYLESGGPKEYFESIEEFEWNEANLNLLRKEVSAKSRKLPKPGVVYLAKGNGLYKIGRSSSFDVRGNHLTTKLPFPVEIIHVIRAGDSVFVEKYWHTRFGDMRIRGEWFDLGEIELAEFTKQTEM